MAPILFLFLTQAMMEEALEAEWTSVKLTYPTFRPNEKNESRKAPWWAKLENKGKAV